MLLVAGVVHGVVRLPHHVGVATVHEREVHRPGVFDPAEVLDQSLDHVVSEVLEVRPDESILEEDVQAGLVHADRVDLGPVEELLEQLVGLVVELTLGETVQVS